MASLLTFAEGGPGILSQPFKAPIMMMISINAKPVKRAAIHLIANSFRRHQLRRRLVDDCLREDLSRNPTEGDSSAFELGWAYMYATSIDLLEVGVAAVTFILGSGFGRSTEGRVGLVATVSGVLMTAAMVLML